MDSLSNEILHEIVSYLFTSDLNSVRLVSRRFYATANLFKFRDLHVRVNYQGLDNLLKISRQPELAQCVRKITYPFRRLAVVMSPYLGIVDFGVNPLLLQDVEIFSEDFYNWYKENYVDQIGLEESGEYFLTLDTALSRMPNIKVIITGYVNYGVRGEFEHWRKTLTDKGRDFIDRCGRDNWPNILELIEDNENDKERALKTAMDLITTSDRLGFKLDSFQFNIASCWLRLGLFHNDSELWGCRPLFGNLTCLSVRITTPDLEVDLEELNEASKEGQLHKFLSFAPNLRKLSLAIENLDDQEITILASSDFKNPVISFLDILGRHQVWKYLHTFSLKFPSIILEETVAFLGRHAKTLKCLHLQSPMLLNGTWRQLLDFLKERLHLTGFKIVSPCNLLHEGCLQLRNYNVDAEIRMQNYVLHGGAPFPPTEQELEENGLDMSEYMEYLSEDSYEEEDE